ncbi:capsid assembly scaffolding protein [Oenococcus phage vB_OeS_unk162]|nr:capsid assembly scaffolding protein [Oenococcus phage vB_OeS_unk162]
MKREELKALSLTDEQIDKIMKINGDDVNSLKADIQSKDSKIEELNGNINGLNTQVKDQKAAVDKLSKNPELTDDQKKQFEDLKTQLSDTEKKFKDELKQTKINSAVELGLTKAGARNSKAARALLDISKVSLDDNGNTIGLEDQIKNLKTADDSKFLFDDGTAQKPAPSAISKDKPNVKQPGEVQQSELLKAFDLKPKPAN